MEEKNERSLDERVRGADWFTTGIVAATILGMGAVAYGIYNDWQKEVEQRKACRPYEMVISVQGRDVARGVGCNNPNATLPEHW